MDVETRNFLLLKLAETLGVIAVIMISGTSKTFVYRPVQFKYPQRESRAGWIVTLLALVSVTFIYFSDTKNALFLGSDQQALLIRLFVAFICLAITALAL